MTMIRGLINQLRLTWRLLRDPRVPLWAKLIPVGALIYVLSPLDLIPDLIPVLGQLDDLGIVLAGMRLFESFVPEYIVQEHLQAIASGQSGRAADVVDAPSYHVKSDKLKNEN
jgi:uncharacterized membrane protein YkvA (DUF1232 family)